MQDPNSAEPQASTSSSSSTVPTIEERRHKLQVGRDRALSRFDKLLGLRGGAPLYDGDRTSGERVRSALNEYIGASREAGVASAATVGVSAGDERISWLVRANVDRSRARLRLHIALAETGLVVLTLMELEQHADKAGKRAHLLAILDAEVLDSLSSEQHTDLGRRIDAEIGDGHTQDKRFDDAMASYRAAMAQLSASPLLDDETAARARKAARNPAFTSSSERG